MDNYLESAVHPTILSLQTKVKQLESEVDYLHAREAAHSPLTYQLNLASLINKIDRSGFVSYMMEPPTVQVDVLLWVQIGLVLV